MKSVKFLIMLFVSLLCLVFFSNQQSTFGKKKGISSQIISHYFPSNSGDFNLINRPSSFLETEFQPMVKSKFFKGIKRTAKYKMNPEDLLSYSNTYEVIQKKLEFDVDIDMQQERIFGYVRIYFECLKPSKFITLDVNTLEIFKVLNSQKNNLNFSFIRKTDVSKALGLGLKIELDSVCDSHNNLLSYVDIYYSTTDKSLAIHFSHKSLLENEKYNFMYTHGPGIFARTLFPCQDTPFAKVQVTGRLRIDQAYTALFSGVLKHKKEIQAISLEKKYLKMKNLEQENPFAKILLNNENFIGNIRSGNMTNLFKKLNPYPYNPYYSSSNRNISSLNASTGLSANNRIKKNHNQKISKSNVNAQIKSANSTNHIMSLKNKVSISTPSIFDGTKNQDISMKIKHLIKKKVDFRTNKSAKKNMSNNRSTSFLELNNNINEKGINHATAYYSNNYDEEITYNEFYFVNDKPISSYLISFSAGYLRSREFGDKCLVYGEPKILQSDKTSATFSDCSEFVNFYEMNFHKNEWGKMVFIIVPDDFPYGGMENPYNIHVTKSYLTEDGSLRNVVAHEIAHFWSGNLVTNKNWEHFWLNEGFTNYLYRKCYQKLFGEDEFNKELDKSQKRLSAFLKKEAELENLRKEKNKKGKIEKNNQKINEKHLDNEPSSNKDMINNDLNTIAKQAKLSQKVVRKNKKLTQIINQIENKITKISSQVFNIEIKHNEAEEEDYKDSLSVKSNKKSHLSLWPKIKKSDPYNNFSLIPYEKGFLFLYYLETKLGEKFVFTLLQKYFEKFKFSSLTTFDFINLLKNEISKANGKEKAKKIYKQLNLKQWIHGIKNIPVQLKAESDILIKIKNFVGDFINYKIPTEAAFSKMREFNVYYQNYILSAINSKIDAATRDSSQKLTRNYEALIDKYFALEKKDKLESATKSKLIIYKASLIVNKEEKKSFLLKTLEDFKCYHVTYLKKILAILKFECDMNNKEIISSLGKLKNRLNKLTMLRLMQFIHKN